MELDRRRFVSLIGAFGVSQVVPESAKTQSNQTKRPSYDEVRSKLSGAKLFFVPYGHNDYGWLNTNLWDRARTPLVHKEALEIMRREKEFKWFLDTEFEALSWFLEEYPEMLDELKQRVKEGRWGVAAGSFCNPDNLFMEPEAIIRNLVLGRRDFERMFPGVNLEVAVFNDIHPGFSQIPQLMRKAGYRFYRVTRPNKGLDRKGYKREFVWEGLDGTEIVFSHGPYVWQGEDLDPNGRPRFTDINNYGNDWGNAVVAFYESAVKDLLPNSATGLIYLPLGFDYGRPLRVFFEINSDEPYLDVPGFLREWKKRESVPLKFAIPIEYFTELDKFRSSLPRVKGVIEPVGWPYWYGGCGSQGLYQWRERNTRDLVEAEIFSSIGSLLDASYPAQHIESLWYDKLTLDPHDGLYVADEDVMALIDLARNVEYECRELRREVMKRLSHRIAADSEKQAIVLFNPLSWRRREIVELHAVFPMPGIKRVRVVDAEGRTLAHQLLKVRHKGRDNLHYKEVWMLVEAEVPPLGYTTLYIQPEEGGEEAKYPDSPVQILENSYGRLRLGEGGIGSFEDKARGVEYLGAGNPAYYTVNDVWVYHGGPITGEAKVNEAHWKLVEEGSLRSTAKMEGKLGPHRVEMSVSLYHSLERVDIQLQVDSVGGSGYFVAQVPFGYSGSLKAGIPFGAEVRDLSREPFGEEAGEERLRKNVFYAHHWVDYNDGQKGLTLLAAEGQRGFHYEPQSRTLGHILLMTITPFPVESPHQHHGTQGEMETYFSNRFFRGTGRHEFRYSLLPHRGDWKTARSLFQAQEQLYPVRWQHIQYHPRFEATGNGGPVSVQPREGLDLPLTKSFLSVNPETVALSSWYWNEGAYYLRLYESTGQEANVEVQLPFDAKVCESVDLIGRRSETPRVILDGGKARFSVQPWEIVSLRISPHHA
jgi:alpha-mannosidase